MDLPYSCHWALVLFVALADVETMEVLQCFWPEAPWAGDGRSMGGLGVQGRKPQGGNGGDGYVPEGVLEGVQCGGGVGSEGEDGSLQHSHGHGHKYLKYINCIRIFENGRSFFSI